MHYDLPKIHYELPTLCKTVENQCVRHFLYGHGQRYIGVTGPGQPRGGGRGSFAPPGLLVGDLDLSGRGGGLASGSARRRGRGSLGPGVAARPAATLAEEKSDPICAIGQEARSPRDPVTEEDAAWGASAAPVVHEVVLGVPM